MYDGTVRKSLGVFRIDVRNRDEKLMRLEFELLETRHHTLLPLFTCLKLNQLSYETKSVCLSEAKEADYGGIFRCFHRDWLLTRGV